jgi:hypothetical protein
MFLGGYGEAFRRLGGSAGLGDGTARGTAAAISASAAGVRKDLNVGMLSGRRTPVASEKTDNRGGLQRRSDWTSARNGCLWSVTMSLLKKRVSIPILTKIGG